MSGKKTGISKKVLIIAGIIEVVLIIAILFSIFYKDPTYNTYLSEGQEQLSNKQYEQALESFEKALEKNPDGIEALMGESDAYMGLKKYDQAISKLEKAKEIAPNNPEIYNKLIIACVKSDDIDKANELILESIELGLPTGEITAVQPAPTISPKSGSYNEAISVTIKSAGDDPIYYTTNGKIPTADDKKYKKPLEITKNGKYRVIALTIQQNGLIGFPATSDYTIKLEIKRDKYLGTWTDGETTLTITDVNGDNIKFNVSLDWVDEVIKTSSSGTVKDGILNFSYTDNFGNTGTGTLTFADDSITVKFRESKSGTAVTPGFGKYTAVLQK